MRSEPLASETAVKCNLSLFPTSRGLSAGSRDLGPEQDPWIRGQAAGRRRGKFCYLQHSRQQAARIVPGVIEKLQNYELSERRLFAYK